MDHPERDSGLLTAFGVLKPPLGHEEGSIDTGMTSITGVAKEYSYWAVGNLTQGATVLAGYASRMLPPV